MLVEWSAECEADDPVLVVPWSPQPGMGPFIDLRENPYDLDHIPEAEQHPPIMQALRALNASRSPVFTAKCDAWPLDFTELEALRINLNLSDVEAPAGFASYIDLVWRERPFFVGFHQLEQRLTRLARVADPLDHAFAAVDCIIRPAFVDLTGPQEGFAVSLYVKATGTDAPHSYENWARALADIVTLLRARDLATS